MTELLYKRNWFKWLAVLLILFLLFISLLPLAVRYGIESWYRQQGADSVSLENVDINLFTGKLRLANLEVRQGGHETLAFSHVLVQLDWLPLFKKRIFIPALEVDGLRLLVEQRAGKHLIVAGLGIPESRPLKNKEKNEPWGFGLHGVVFRNSKINFTTPEQQTGLEIDSFTLDKLKSWSQDDTLINYSGKVNSAPVTLTGLLDLFDTEPGFEGKLKINDFDLSPVATYIKDYAHNMEGLFSVDTSLSIRHKPGQWTRFRADSDAQVHNLVLGLLKQDISQDKLQWQGKLDVTLNSKGQSTVYLLTGRLETENLDIKQGHTLQYHHGRLDWQGSIRSRQHFDMPTISGRISGTEITLTRLPGQQQLFHTNTLLIKKIAFSGLEDISTGTIKLTGPRALYRPVATKEKQNPAFLQAVGLEIDSISLSKEKGYAVGRIRLSDALIYIHRQKNGRLQHIASLDIPAMQSSDKGKTKITTPVTPRQQNGKPLKLTISNIGLTGNSRIRIFDETVSPAFDTEIRLARASINNINSGRPGKASPFLIEAKLGRFSSIALKGNAYPYAKALTIKLEGDIKNISLPPVSGYLAKILGYDIRSGQLNAHIKLDINNGAIDASNRLLISNLEVKVADPDRARQLTAQLDIPLESALSLLRNKNNDIDLVLPVKGNAANPDFQIGSIINKAIGNAMKKASLTYLTYALQPYGGLITIARLIKSAADTISLNPINFPAGSSATDKTSLDYASRIASLMNERPGLRIKLCGIATETDRNRLLQDNRTTWLANKRQEQNFEANIKIPASISVAENQLLGLAQKRAEVIKSYLVTEYKIDTGRLFICQPRIDPDKKGNPRLNLTI